MIVEHVIGARFRCPVGCAHSGTEFGIVVADPLEAGRAEADAAGGGWWTSGVSLTGGVSTWVPSFWPFDPVLCIERRAKSHRAQHLLGLKSCLLFGKGHPNQKVEDGSQCQKVLLQLWIGCDLSEL